MIFSLSDSLLRPRGPSQAQAGNRSRTMVQGNMNGRRGSQSDGESSEEGSEEEDRRAPGRRDSEDEELSVNEKIRDSQPRGRGQGNSSVGNSSGGRGVRRDDDHGSDGFLDDDDDEEEDGEDDDGDDAEFSGTDDF